MVKFATKSKDKAAHGIGAMQSLTAFANGVCDIMLGESLPLRTHESVTCFQLHDDKGVNI